jgi:hypothetical protein
MGKWITQKGGMTRGLWLFRGSEVVTPTYVHYGPCHLWPRWQALNYTDQISGFMEPDKPSSPVTTFLNRTTT